MAKFYGAIGFASEQTEIRPGVWEDQIVERPYFGDVVRNIRRLQTADKVNDDLKVSNEISVVGDPYAYENFHKIRYAVYMGSRWKVDSVEVQYPRLILTIGGVYNGRSAT